MGLRNATVRGNLDALHTLLLADLWRVGGSRHYRDGLLDWANMYLLIFGSRGFYDLLLLNLNRSLATMLWYGWNVNRLLGRTMLLLLLVARLNFFLEFIKLAVKESDTIHDIAKHGLKAR